MNDRVRPKRLGNNQNYYYPNKERTFWMSSPISNEPKKKEDGEGTFTSEFTEEFK